MKKRGHRGVLEEWGPLQMVNRRSTLLYALTSTGAIQFVRDVAEFTRLHIGIL